MSTAVAVLVPLALALGFWQLDRAEHKRAYQDALFSRLAAAPVAGRDTLAPEPFQRVRLEGQFEAGQYFLVDNQVADGLVGYWVVQSFFTLDGRRWLVNRGWIAGGDRRDQLPRVPEPAGTVVTVGVAWPDLGLVPLLGEDDWSRTWPARVQRLDVARMAQRLEAAVPVEIRLEAAQVGALRAAPLTAGFQSERHDGYAVQWFALAGVLLVGYAAYGLRAARSSPGA
jgi:cytochrome oxidase assembly protein ShyY1